LNLIPRQSKVITRPAQCYKRSKMTASERNEALRDANEKMKFYYENRPSIQTLKKSSRKLKFGDENSHFIQAGAISTFLCLFLFTPFLGKKIAQDEEFRKKYIPAYYDYTLEKPDYAWTRQELHEQMVQLQKELHERAINGEFTPEKLEEMRRHFNGVDPKNDEHGWGKIHPGVDDDEDVEDD